MAAGYYQVQVTKRDAPECPTVINVKVEKANTLTANATITRKATCGQSNGAATINVTGGSNNYTYSWGTTATKTDLAARIYAVTVTDNEAGCKATTTFTVGNEATGSSVITIAESIVYVNCFGDKNGISTTTSRLQQAIHNRQRSVSQMHKVRFMKTAVCQKAAIVSLSVT